MKTRRTTKASLLKEIEEKTRGGSPLVRNLLLDDLKKRNKPKSALEYVNKHIRVSRNGAISIQ